MINAEILKELNELGELLIATAPEWSMVHSIGERLVEISEEEGGRMMVIYRHMSGVKGTFYKRYRPTGLSYYYIMVDTFDGRRFYAPEKEWEILK